MQQRLDTIQKAILDITGVVVEAEHSDVTDVAAKKAGMFRGLYYIDPARNFYFGLAKSQTACIATARMNTHVLKLTVDLSGLYGSVNEKCEPFKQFPAGWNYAMRKHYINESSQAIPSHWTKAEVIPEGKGGKSGNKWVKPGCLHYPVTYREGVDVMKLPVVLWNLDPFTPQQIKDIESAVIAAIEPEANDETYKKYYKKLDK
jgi:hypothetical protein